MNAHSSTQANTPMGLPHAKITIAIPSFNRAKLAINLLNNIYKQIQSLSAAAELIRVCLLDNASDYDEGYNEVQFLCNSFGFRYYSGIQNVGWAGNFSRAYISSANSDYLWILSDDDALADNALELIVNLLSVKRPPKLLCFNPHLKLNLYAGSSKQWIRYARSSDIAMISANTLVSSVIFRRTLFDFESFWRYEGYWFPHSYSVFGTAICEDTSILVLPSSRVISETGNTAQERILKKDTQIYKKLNREFQRACLCFTNYCLFHARTTHFTESEYIGRVSEKFCISPSLVEIGMSPIHDILGINCNDFMAHEDQGS